MGPPKTRPLDSALKTRKYPSSALQLQKFVKCRISQGWFLRPTKRFLEENCTPQTESSAGIDGLDGPQISVPEIGLGRRIPNRKNVFNIYFFIYWLKNVKRIFHTFVVCTYKNARMQI